MTSEVEHPEEYRVLLLPATRRDAEVTTALLRREKLPVVCCHTARLLARELDGGVGAILMTDDALADPGIDLVLEALGRQPPWSDIPRDRVVWTRQLPEIGGHRNADAAQCDPARAAYHDPRLDQHGEGCDPCSRASISNPQAAHDAPGIGGRGRLRERQLHTLAENTPDVLFRLDRQLGHVLVDQAAAEVTGLRVSDSWVEPIGRSAWRPSFAINGNRFTRDVRGRSAPPAGLSYPGGWRRVPLRARCCRCQSRGQRRRRDRAERARTTQPRPRRGAR